MKMLKVPCLLLTAVLTFSLFIAGCAKTEDEAETGVPATVDKGGSEADNKGKPAEGGKNAWERWELPSKTVELLWYVIGSTEQDDQDLVEEKVSNYLSGKINATVDIIFMDYVDYMEVMGTKLAAGERIDICFTSGWAGSAEYKKNAGDGNFVPLNDYLKEGGILEGTARILGEDFLGATKIKGINYAIPCNKEKAHNWGFLARKDIVEKLGLDAEMRAVKKTSDLGAILKKVKDAYPEMISLVTATGEAPWRLLDWDTINDDSVPGALYPDGRNNTVINQFATPEAKEHFEVMRDFYLKGYIRKDAATYTDWQNDLNSGLGFCVSQSMKPGKGVEYSQGKDYDFLQYDVTEPVMSNRESDGSMMAIPIASKNPDRAAMLLEIANTDKYLNNLLNFGIDGKHYKKVPGRENIIELTDDAGWRPNITWVFPNQFMNYVMSNEDPDKFVNFEKYNLSAKPLNSLGFVYDISNTSNQISALKQIVNEYTPRLFSGSAKVEKILPEFLNKLEQASAAEVIADMQAQYDEWLKNK